MFESHTTQKLRFVLTIASGAVLAACGGQADAPGGAPAASSMEQQPVQVANPATIRGVVNFDGAPPALQTIDMSEEPQCAQVHTSPPVQLTAAVNDGRLANVFVYVKEGLSQSFPPPSQPAVLNQHGCLYEPRVLGIQVGQPLTVRNSDPLLHNINMRPTINRGANFSQPNIMESNRPPFASAEIMVPVRCDVHGWMQAYIGVVDHPFFAVSAADGTFTISGLPPGTYVVEAWHERYGTQTMNVTVGPNESADIAFTYSEQMAADAIVPLGEPIDLHDHTGEHGHTALHPAEE